MPPFLILALCAALFLWMILALWGPRGLAILVALGCLMAIGPRLAFAQTDTTPHGAQDVLNALMPWILGGVGAFLAAVLALATTALTKLNQKWAADMLQANSARIATALTNAAGGLIQSYGAKEAMVLDASHPGVTAAAAEVVARIGPTLAKAGITPASVAQRVIEKIPQVLPVEAAPIVVAPAAVPVDANAAAAAVKLS